MGVFVLGGALGALLAYFFDPQNGNRRRHVAVNRTTGLLRAGIRKAKDFDDATLADKIRSEVFRDPALPKGKVNVNVQNGVVQLRGEVPRAELIEDLVKQTRKVHGVRDVENLLHLPGAQAPMHA
jgi:osmotically-inducible protein OsmY